MLEITDYLENIFQEFKQHSDKELIDDMTAPKKGIRDNSPRYKPGEPWIYHELIYQQRYLLKYAYAYGFEYLSMCNAFVEDFADKEEISAVSLGCGTMLDYWALAHMLDKKNISRPVVRYHGIDVVKWNYCMKAETGDIVEFSEESFEQFFQRQKNQFHTHDVYFFPKSISEISYNDMEILLDRLSETEKDTVYFCITLRMKPKKAGKERMVPSDDVKKVKKIIDKLKDEKAGFRLEYAKCMMDTETKKAELEEKLGVENMEFIKLGSDRTIEKTDMAKNILAYPLFSEDYNTFVRELRKKCVKYPCKECRNRKLGLCDLYYGQMLRKTGYFCDLILKFERR